MSTPIETIIDKNSGSEIPTDEILAQSGFYWRERNGVKILVCKPLEDAGFVNGFSTRHGGVSNFPKNSLNLAGFDEDSTENIMENRKRLLACFDKNFMLSTAWQIHGDGIKVVENLDQARDGNAKFDALTSNLQDILVGAKTADCVPILLGDTKTNAFAAVHAGWRGTVQSIAVKTVKVMQEKFGTHPKDLIAAIGAAAVVNYEVGKDVIDSFNENFSTCGKLFTPTRENHAFVDLHLANADQLESVGLSTEKIFTAPLCTMKHNSLFFSYRLEKKTFGKTGRLLSVIGIK